MRPVRTVIETPTFQKQADRANMLPAEIKKVV